MKNSSSVEYIAAATSVRVSKNLGLIPFDLKTRSQDFINQVRVEPGYPSENAGFCSGRTELFPEKTQTYPTCKPVSSEQDVITSVMTSEKTCLLI